MANKFRRERSYSSFFLELIGVSDSNNGFWTIWFIIALIRTSSFGLVANITVLIGCMSPSTQSVYLFRVSSEDLVHATTNLTSLVPAKELAIRELPRHWYWGLSGVCAAYDGDEVFCNKAFPPTQSIDEMIAFAVKTQVSDDAAVAKLTKSWTKALDNLSSILPSPSSSTTKLKASVALTLLSTIISFLLLPLAILSLGILRSKLRRWMLYTLALVDALLFLGGGVLAIFGMNEGPRSIIQTSGINQGNERTFIGPGFYVLFAGVLFKLISIGIFFVVAFWMVLVGVMLVMACLGGLCGGRDGKKREEVVEYEYHEYPAYGGK
ncbi:hypothetical protein G7046_g4469 [Stylonectria norvegica]|nr:hypothetical protein G7046_g4469 [Stylonectria norvegica]